jgi:hypothetical protein
MYETKVVDFNETVSMSHIYFWYDKPFYKNVNTSILTHFKEGLWWIKKKQN